MPNENLQTTITTQAPQTGLNKTYYDRTLLETAKTQFVYQKYGQQRPIPKRNGKRIEMRRWSLFDPTLAMTPLVEGETPDGLSLQQDIVEAVINQYGAYFTYSDILDFTAYDEVINSGVERLGEMLGTVVEWVTRDELVTGNNVNWAGAATSRSTITANDKLTTLEIRRAVRDLKKRKARMFNRGGRKHYIAIVSPDAAFDLQADEMWIAANTYVNQEALYSGELGRMFGVVFIESTEAPVVDENGLDVHQTVVFGQDAYGVVGLGSAKGGIETIIKGLGDAGFDPLDQRGTVGAKVFSYAAKILNEDWILRIEHAVSQ